MDRWSNFFHSLFIGFFSLYDGVMYWWGTDLAGYCFSGLLVWLYWFNGLLDWQLIGLMACWFDSLLD